MEYIEYLRDGVTPNRIMDPSERFNSIEGNDRYSKEELQFFVILGCQSQMSEKEFQRVCF